MAALSIGTHSNHKPQDFASLLTFLSTRPQPALVHYSPTGSIDEQRIELSGRVLANWLTKLINLLREEYSDELSEAFSSEFPDEVPAVLVDGQLHWNSLLAATAAWGLGTHVEARFRGPEHEEQTGSTLSSNPALPSSHVLPSTPADLQFLLTDRPTLWLQEPQKIPEHCLAVSPMSLKNSFSDATGESIPSWILDVAAEVRQQPDQLTGSLPHRDLPDGPAHASTQGPLLVTDVSWGNFPLETHTEELDVVMNLESALVDCLRAWAEGRTVVLFTAGERVAAEKSDQRKLWDMMLTNEGIKR